MEFIHEIKTGPGDFEKLTNFVERDKNFPPNFVDKLIKEINKYSPTNTKKESFPMIEEYLNRKEEIRIATKVKIFKTASDYAQEIKMNKKDFLY